MNTASRGFRLTEEGAEEIKNEINRQGLSNQQLAEISSCSRATLDRLLRRERVSRKLLNKVFSALNFDIERKMQLVENYPTFVRFGEGTNKQPDNPYSIEREEAVLAISEATPGDIQVIASAQIEILDSYHKEVLQQAKKSFLWALLSSIGGFVLFLTAVFFLLQEQPKERAIIPLIGGTFVEVISGVNFYLYGRTTKQLSSFHRRLDRTQRFLLANSMCESIDGELKQTTRAELVKTVSSFIDQETK